LEDLAASVAGILKKDAVRQLGLDHTTTIR
jgi:hypothetical protein